MLYAATIVAVNGIHSGGTVISGLSSNRRCCHRMCGVCHYRSALDRVKNNASKRRARGE